MTSSLTPTVEEKKPTDQNWSCTSSLRVIPSAQKPGKIPSYNDEMRAFCHGIASFFLPTRLTRSTLVVHHAPLHLAKRSGHTTSGPIPASLTTPKALPRAKTLCRSHP